MVTNTVKQHQTICSITTTLSRDHTFNIW